MNTRRQFLIRAPLGFLVAAAACSNDTPTPAPPIDAGGRHARAPPTFGTGAGSGPAVTPATFAEAEKLMQVTMTAAERQQAADSWRQSLAQYLERRTGPRKVALADTDAPATIWNPMLPGHGGAVNPRSICPIDAGRQAVALIRRCDRVRAGHRVVAMDRIAATVIRAADADLSEPNRAARRKDPLRDHADPRSRARAREGGGCRDRRPESTAARSTACRMA